MPVFKAHERLDTKLCIPLILLASVALTLPVFIDGVPKGNDLQQHLQFGLTFYNSILEGDLIPSLSTTTNFGFGDVGVRFYPPLSYYVLALFRIVSGSWHDAAALSFVVWFFLGGTGIYLWSREYFSDAASLVAALAYLIAPYHVNEIYNASFFAEFAGAGVLPFCFLFVTRLIKKQSAVNIAALAAAYAALVLTHLPSAVIGSCGLLVFGIFSLRRQNLIRSIASLVIAVAAGLLLSSFYWIKVVTELPLVNHSSAEFIAKNYDFKFNFVASYFYVAADTYNDRFLWMSDLMFAVTVGLFVPAILLKLLSDRSGTNSRDGLIAAFGVFALGVLLATPLSVSVWENVSTLQKIQFPFRWMVLINVAGAFLLAAGFSSLRTVLSTRLRPLAVLCVGLMTIAAAFTAAQVIRPALFIPKAGFDEYVATLTDQPSYRCWLPVWASESALTNKQTVSPAERIFSYTRSNAYERHFHFVAGREETLRLPVFYYPHWKAEIDGVNAPIGPGVDGALTFLLPSNAAAAKVYFQEPLIARIAVGVSLFSWLAVLAFAVVSSIKKVKNYVNRNSDRKLI